MMTASVINLSDEPSSGQTSQHWHKRAQEIWEKARQIEDPSGKYEMQTIAFLYEALAGYEERRERNRKMA